MVRQKDHMLKVDPVDTRSRKGHTAASHTVLPFIWQKAVTFSLGSWQTYFTLWGISFEHHATPGQHLSFLFKLNFISAKA